MLAKSESNIKDIFCDNKTPIIKLKANKIIQPKEIDIGELSLLEWLKKNKNELTFTSSPHLVHNKENANIRTYYNPDWNLYELLLDENEDFSIIEDVDKENSQFQNDVRQFNILQKNLEIIFDFIEPTSLNKQSFSLQLRNIILLSSMEVEVHWQNLLRNNGYTKNRMTTKDYVKLCEFINFNFEFKLASFPEFGLIKPYKNWNVELPTKSLEWYNAYNKIKHDRSSNLHLATLEFAITSVSAVLVLLHIRYGKINLNNVISNNIFTLLNNTVSKHVVLSNTVSKHVLSGFHMFFKNRTYKKYFLKE